MAVHGTTATVPPVVDLPPTGRASGPIPPMATGPATRRAPGRPAGPAKKLPDERTIRQILATTFGSMNFALAVTGQARYALTAEEVAALVEAWTRVILAYPEAMRWFDRGAKVSVWGNAVIVTVSICVPKFLGIDLMAPVGWGSAPAPAPDGSGHGTNGAVPAADVPTGASSPDGLAGGPIAVAGGQPGGARVDRGDDGLWQDDARTIVAGAA